jgi:hypothetical protein
MKTRKFRYCISAALAIGLITVSAVYAASMYNLSYVERFENESCCRAYGGRVHVCGRGLWRCG